MVDDDAEWAGRLRVIVETMREISLHRDPQQMVQAYARRLAEITQLDRRVSVSRRGLQYPWYRITRSTTWTEDVNPWKQRDQLPLLSGGVLADWIYGEQALVLNDWEAPEDDPAAEYLRGCRSVAVIPMFDEGESLNLVVLMQCPAGAFPPDQLPDLVWRSNLFGRATSNLVLRAELHDAYQALDRELRIVGDIQKSLLPAQLPAIPGLRLAAHYQPAQRAGGDYYDFFPLGDNHHGMIVADVSGHGTPAAVLMAVTHCIAHMSEGRTCPPARMMQFVNQHLSGRYTTLGETFVTAFYATFDPGSRRLRYCNAGHNPPRLRRGSGEILALDAAGTLPLGITDGIDPEDAETMLQPGDALLLYTDGVTEAMNGAGELFGVHRLDDVVSAGHQDPGALVEAVLAAVDDFCAGQAPTDDRTLVAAIVD